jgi:7-cyano-7-deazaguanine reductase
MKVEQNETVDPKIGQVAEGKTLPFVDETHIKTEELKTFEFESKSQLIKIETDEFSAVCPFSGLPDIATLIIEYYPKGKAVELKALKYYLMSFRMVGIYQEAVTKRIFEDLKKVLGHNQITITSLYNTRGGMDVTCVESGVKGVVTGY